MNILGDGGGMEWDGGYGETVDIFRGHRKTGLFLGAISKHSRAFS